MKYVIAFLVLSIIIIEHELGHFIVAKARKGRSTRQRGTDAFALSPNPGPGRILLLRPCRRRTGGNDEL